MARFIDNAERIVDRFYLPRWNNPRGISTDDRVGSLESSRCIDQSMLASNREARSIVTKNAANRTTSHDTFANPDVRPRWPSVWLLDECHLGRPCDGISSLRPPTRNHHHHHHLWDTTEPTCGPTEISRGVPLQLLCSRIRFKRAERAGTRNGAVAALRDRNM